MAATYYSHVASMLLPSSSLRALQLRTCAWHINRSKASSRTGAQACHLTQPQHHEFLCPILRQAAWAWVLQACMLESVLAELANLAAENGSSTFCSASLGEEKQGHERCKIFGSREADASNGTDHITHLPVNHVPRHPPSSSQGLQDEAYSMSCGEEARIGKLMRPNGLDVISAQLHNFFVNQQGWARRRLLSARVIVLARTERKCARLCGHPINDLFACRQLPAEASTTQRIGRQRLVFFWHLKRCKSSGGLVQAFAGIRENCTAILEAGLPVQHSASIQHVPPTSVQYLWASVTLSEQVKTFCGHNMSDLCGRMILT